MIFPYINFAIYFKIILLDEINYFQLFTSILAFFLSKTIKNNETKAPIIVIAIIKIKHLSFKYIASIEEAIAPPLPMHPVIPKARPLIVVGTSSLVSMYNKLKHAAFPNFATIIVAKIHPSLP